MPEVPMTEARKHFGTLVRRAATTRERTTITEHGQPAVVLVNAQELADLEDALALAQYDARRARHVTAPVPQDDARRRLGLPRT